MSKPKLCEMFGVEVGQRFRTKIGIPVIRQGKKEISDESVVLHIESDGTVFDSDGKNSEGALDGLCYAIEHPDEIIPYPEWTQKDIDDACAVDQLWPHAYKVRREADGSVSFSQHTHGIPDMPGRVELDRSAFPSLQKGEETVLDILLLYDEE